MAVAAILPLHARVRDSATTVAHVHVHVHCEKSFWKKQEEQVARSKGEIQLRPLCAPRREEGTEIPNRLPASRLGARD